MKRNIGVKITDRLFSILLSRVAGRRLPDFIVGGRDHPYLSRWYVIPRNPLFNVYLHRFTRSDDDRALHDHPWLSLSVCLHGSMVEHTIAQGGVQHRRTIVKGDLCLRSGSFAHRLELPPIGQCWTLFITGPVYREWGFHCITKGWVPHAAFVSSDDKGTTGLGCAAASRAPRRFWQVFTARDA